MSPPRVVVLRPLGLGDFLTGVPAYRGIARAFPEHEVVLAAPRTLEPLAALSGAFARVHDTRPLVPLDAALHGADVAVDLHGRGPASQRILLAARPHRLVAFASAEAGVAQGAIWREDEHEVQRWCRMLGAAGIAADPADLDLAVPAAATPVPDADATLIHPSAASAARRWPPERWAAVARAERRVGRRVIVTGDARDRALAEAIAAAAELPRADVLAGTTSLSDLAALVAHAGRVVCGDTGVAHLATAYRTPSVVLFGPIPPAWWGPPADRPYHRALWRGRRGDPHGGAIDLGLLAIGVDEVLDALHDLDGVSDERRAAAAAG